MPDHTSETSGYRINGCGQYVSKIALLLTEYTPVMFIFTSVYVPLLFDHGYEKLTPHRPRQGRPLHRVSPLYPCGSDTIGTAGLAQGTALAVTVRPRIGVAFTPVAAAAGG